MYMYMYVHTRLYFTDVDCRLVAYEELYRKMKAQSVEDYKAALKEQVYSGCAHCLPTFPYTYMHNTG